MLFDFLRFEFEVVPGCKSEKSELTGWLSAADFVGLVVVVVVVVAVEAVDDGEEEPWTKFKKYKWVILC